MTVSPQVKNALLIAFLSSVFTLIILTLANYLINHTWNMFAAGESSTQQPFTVEGTGTASAQPDQSTITFSVSKTATTLKDAQNQANTSMSTITSDLQKAGVLKKDIQTENYSSNPNYDTTQSGGPLGAIPFRQNGTNIISYTVLENATVTLHEVNKANSVIDTLTKDGAENVYGPSLAFSDTVQQNLTEKARIAAITDAKKKADDLASAAGIHLGRITNIQIGNNSNPLPVQPLMMRVDNTGGGTVPTQINPGENTVTVTVTLSYTTW